jgi:hypothetical protein
MAASVAEQYMNEMHDKFGYFATWTPESELHIGDVGELHGNQFSYLSNLKDLGINFETESDNSPGSLNYVSENAVTISTKLKGDAGIPQFNLNVADAGIIVNFSRDKGVVFEAEGVVQTRIKNVIAVDRAILKAYKSGDWKHNWAAISEIKSADSGTVLISQGGDAAIGLKAKAQVPKMSLANINANFDITYSRNLATTILCTRGLTPLFKIRGIVTPLFGLGSPHVEGKYDKSFPTYIGSTGSDRPATEKKSEIVMGEIEFKR